MSPSMTKPPPAKAMHLVVGSGVQIRLKEADGRRHFIHHAKDGDVGIIEEAPPTSPWFVVRFDACGGKRHRLAIHELVPSTVAT